MRRSRIMKTLSFANGDAMPLVGLGTWKANPGDVYQAVKEAVRAGYRHIDCAPIYGNEVEVGKAISESFNSELVSRDELWVTSKLWNNAHAPRDVEPALRKTLADLRLDYLDLFLVHWPVLIDRDQLYPRTGQDLISLDQIPISKTWRAMEDLVAKGLCRHIGISNFSVAKIKSLLESAEIRPEMNQIELHPYLQQKNMLQFCEEKNIHLTAYAPLGSADRPRQLKADDEPLLLEDPAVKNIAVHHSATPAQILLSWAIHRNVAVIPKSIHPERIRENLEAQTLSLSTDDLAEIDRLDRNRRYITGSFWTMEGSPYTLENLWDEERAG